MNLFRPLWFTWKGKDGYGGGGGYLQIKIFCFLLTMARAQGKHRKFGINWSMAILYLFRLINLDINLKIRISVQKRFDCYM